MTVFGIWSHIELFDKDTKNGIGELVQLERRDMQNTTVAWYISKDGTLQTIDVGNVLLKRVNQFHSADVQGPQKLHLPGLKM